MTRSFPRHVLVAVAAALVPCGASQAQNGAASSPAPDSSARAQAVRADTPPVIDGREDDAVWRSAPATSDFREFSPTEGKTPRFRTEFRAAYDDNNLYVFVRAHDSAPDSIMTDLTRRDVRGSSDQLKLMVDSYFDRRNGFEFAVNPSGVKRDYAMYNDRDEDDSWDAVWDVATRIDSAGWTAEFRIPFSQLRYANAPSHTFGFAIWRDIERFKERASWPLYSARVNGLVSQLGRLEGIRGISAPTQLEVTPYTLTKSVSRRVDGAEFDRVQMGAVGADIRYGITPNLTLNATVNPDFGQVEADPAVVNLTAFETRFEERRPFFVEGTGLYQFSINCNVVNCGGEGLFYSRRIGRAPQLAQYGGVGAPQATPILGAMKLTGRFPNGMSVGVLEALTPRVEGTQERTMEPFTSYTVARLQQEFRDGGTTVGLIGTGVQRSLDQWTRPRLREAAHVGGVDFRHKFAGGAYEMSGSVMASRVAGDTAVINATQLESAHFFQRPDATHLDYDPTATSLTGHAEEFRVAKFGGGVTRFETSYQRRSPGFEVNDLGFMRRADEQQQATWFALQYRTPTRIYRSLQMNFNQWNFWNTGGLKTETGLNTNWHLNDHRNWWWHMGGTIGQLGSYCDNCTRGGPAIRRSPNMNGFAGVEVDDRRRIAPYYFLNVGRGDYGKSVFVGHDFGLNIRPSSAVQLQLGGFVSRNIDDSHFYTNDTDGLGVTHYTFAHLDQKTYQGNVRVSYTMTPTLTLQVFAQPFQADGVFDNIRETSATPRADAYEDRYQPYAAMAGVRDAFTVRDLRSNTVLRWEFRPGSTLFAVWTHGRDSRFETDGTPIEEPLLAMHPANTFLIKVAYWLSR